MMLEWQQHQQPWQPCMQPSGLQAVITACRCHAARPNACGGIRTAATAVMPLPPLLLLALPPLLMSCCRGPLAWVGLVSPARAVPSCTLQGTRQDPAVPPSCVQLGQLVKDRSSPERL